MSYLPRRPLGGRGGANTQTQVNYHQTNMVRNQGYSTTPQNFTPQQFPGYTTAQPAPPPGPKSTPPPVTPLATPQEAPPPQPIPAETPDVKSEEITEGDQPMDSDPQKGRNGGHPARPLWMKKLPGGKVSRRTKKRRQNARLRRLLIPKNALMFLNELHSGARFSYQERVNALGQLVYTVTVEVEGKTFTGQGMSKLAAKSQASENALKVLILEKMSDSTFMDTSTSLDSTATNTTGTDVTLEEDWDEEKAKEKPETDGESTTGSVKPPKILPEDDLPWGSLAAFALHKLFTEWQQQGTQLPLAKALGATPPQQKVGILAPMKKIPEDASKRHPVVLLNQLKPRCMFHESHEGMPPNMVFNMSVEIDGQTYTGSGTSKKEAKKECAKAALASMGIHSEV